jgi:tetratricopeptide (TPR) repeat protein
MLYDCPMSIRDKFKSILETNAFEELDPYKKPAVWKAMSQDERELLGILFVKQGEQQLEQGDTKVLESFELAKKVAPESAMVYYRQALVYASRGQNIRCLRAAEEALNKATQLDPAFCNAWHSWGNILVRIGLFYDDASYFHQADEKFAQIERLAAKGNAAFSDTLYWHWGICWYHVGKHSGEAVDFFHSLAKFRQAEEREFANGEFHNDYGNILIDLACLVGREELFIEAVDHYEKAIALTSSNYEGWLNLACTYQRLYNFSGSRDYFHKADECFDRAVDINYDNPVIWHHWAELYVSAGKASRDVERFQESFERFKKADALDPCNPYIMLHWCEAQMLAASYSENLALLREAESKIGVILKAIPQQSEAWHIYGLCLCEFGRYFGSEEYYFQAIEQFKRGLEIKDSHPLLIHGIAAAHCAIGELRSDVAMFEKAIGYFNQAADLGARFFPQFLSDWGVALMKLGEMTNEQSHVEEAALKFEEAINGRLDTFENEDIELEWLYNYGCAMDFLGDFHEEPIYYEKAVQVLSHVLKIDPDYVHARYNLALALSHLGELNNDVECFRKAIEFFHDVLTHDPEDEITWNDCGLALLNLAVLMKDPVHTEKTRELYDQAEVKFQHSIALGSLHAYYNLACLYALTHNLPAAIHFLEKAEQCNALPAPEDVIHDEWLDNLRGQAAYRLFISRLLNHLDDE